MNSEAIGYVPRRERPKSENGQTNHRYISPEATRRDRGLTLQTIREVNHRKGRIEIPPVHITLSQLQQAEQAIIAREEEERRQNEERAKAHAESESKPEEKSEQIIQEELLVNVSELPPRNTKDKFVIYANAPLIEAAPVEKNRLIANPVDTQVNLDIDKSLLDEGYKVFVSQNFNAFHQEYLANPAEFIRTYKLQGLVDAQPINTDTMSSFLGMMRVLYSRNMVSQERHNIVSLASEQIAKQSVESLTAYNKVILLKNYDTVATPTPKENSTWYKNLGEMVQQALNKDAKMPKKIKSLLQKYYSLSTDNAQPFYLHASSEQRHEMIASLMTAFRIPAETITPDELLSALAIEDSFEISEELCARDIYNKITESQFEQAYVALPPEPNTNAQSEQTAAEVDTIPYWTDRTMLRPMRAKIEGYIDHSEDGEERGILAIVNNEIPYDIPVQYITFENNQIQFSIPEEMRQQLGVSRKELYAIAHTLQRAIESSAPIAEQLSHIFNEATESVPTVEHTQEPVSQDPVQSTYSEIMQEQLERFREKIKTMYSKMQERLHEGDEKKKRQAAEQMRERQEQWAKIYEELKATFPD